MICPCHSQYMGHADGKDTCEDDEAAGDWSSKLPSKGPRVL